MSDTEAVDVAALRGVAERRPPLGITAPDHGWLSEWLSVAKPPTVLALLDRVEAAEAKVARVEALADEWQRLTLPGMTDWDNAEAFRAALADPGDERGQ